MKKLLLSTFIITILLIGVKPVKAQTVGMKYQTKLVLKILQFDRKYARFGNPIVIGTNSDDVFDAFDALSGKATIGGINFSIEKMKGIEDAKKYKILYIDDNWSDKYAQIAKMAKENKALVITRKEDSLIPCGAISFRKVLNRPKILIHKGNLKAQGSKFSGSVLRIAIIVDK